jgi:photosystem II stability/assembly factor-like uncharacterized protein
MRQGRRTGSAWRAACALATALCVSGKLAAADAPDQPRSAEQAPLAAHSLLTALAQAGERLVAVGDRGVVVLSDDQGRSWKQAASVPTQALLTGICFLDPTHGIAVGHDEVVVVTADAGVSWRRSHYAPQAQQPLLDVWCGSGGRAIAVGAYSTYLTSGDGGASWKEEQFSPAPRPAPPAAARASDDAGKQGGYHLNRIVGADGRRLYIAAEAGHLYRSDDAGGSWVELASPYQGSFFGVLPLGADALLAFGLRGNLFRSDDAGGSWHKLETGTVALLDGGTRFGSDGAAIVGLAGVVLVSGDGGHRFELHQQGDYTGLAAAVASNAHLAVVGEAGTRVIALPDGPQAGAR